MLNVKVNITTSDNCKVFIEDLSTYLDESSNNINLIHEFKYSDTVSIDIVRHNKLNGEVNKEVKISSHDKRELILLPIKINGWFSIVHIILPSKLWIEKNPNIINRYDIIYYSDGLKIYKYDKESGKSEEQNINVLTDLNLNAGKYPIYRTEEDFVSICYLKKCYIDLCKLIFEERGFSKCYNKNTIDSELVYRRDLVWMAINVIKYLTECNLLYEVERIIEQITSCNGLCNYSNLTSKTSGCGCSK